MSLTPVLYHDIDRILFGEYGPRHLHQLRPGVNDWLYWATDRFDIVFVTKWPEHEVHSLLNDLYLKDLIAKGRYLPWFTIGLTKWDAIRRDQVRQAHPFLWIDDHVHEFPGGALRSRWHGGIPFVRVNPTGANELVDLMQRLQARTKKLHIWQQGTASSSDAVISASRL